MVSNNRITIRYTGDPVAALNRAIREHCKENSFILVPAGMDWLLTDKPRRQTRRPFER